VISHPDELGAGVEVVVETAFGEYRGVLVQPHTRGSHVRLRSVGHDMWLHQHSINAVRAVGAVHGDRAEAR
jgi:hypothetical protein